MLKMRPTRGGGNPSRGGRRRGVGRRRHKKNNNPPVPSQPSGCTECNKPEPVYKCPKCFLKYCSVACCKEHKARCSLSVTTTVETETVTSSGCTECDRPESAYACPTCLKKFCSEDCCQEHKTRCAAAPKRHYNYEFPTEDTVPLEKLLEIKNDERINSLLKSSKLRALITKLDEMQNPASSFRNIMANPEFRAFSDTVLDIVGVKDDYNIA